MGAFKVDIEIVNVANPGRVLHVAKVLVDTG
jgi:hypothetical protein